MSTSIEITTDEEVTHAELILPAPILSALQQIQTAPKGSKCITLVISEKEEAALNHLCSIADVSQSEMLYCGLDMIMNSRDSDLIESFAAVAVDRFHENILPEWAKVMSQN